MTSSPSVRALQARAAAHTRWSRTPDRTAATAPARAAAAERWHKAVDPNGLLDPETRDRLAQSLKSAHMSAMARKSALVRAAKKKTSGRKAA